MALIDNIVHMFGADQPRYEDYQDLNTIRLINTSQQPVMSNRVQSVFNNTINPAGNYTTTEIQNYTLNFDPTVATSRNYQNYASLLTELQKEANSKKELKNKLDTIRDYDYIENVIRNLGTDVLTRSYNPSSYGEYFQFHIRNEKFLNLEEPVNNDIAKLNLYGWLTDIMDDLLFYGQYILKMDYEHNELDDQLVQDSAIATYSRGDIRKIYTSQAIGDHRNFRSNGMLYDAREFCIITLFTKYKNLPILADDGTFYNIKLPKGVIPESIIPKIIHLKLLESLQPLIELQAMDQKMFFYIRFPTGYDVSQAYKEATRYEKFLKSMLAMDNLNVSNVDALLEKVSTVKVIPLFGDQNQVESQTLEKVERVDLNQIQDLRDSISNALGISITEDNTVSLAYLKQVKRIRLAIQESISQFLRNYIEIRYKVKLTNKDYELTVPELYGIADLDALEYSNMHASSFNELLGLLTTVSDTLTTLKENKRINMDAVAKFMSSKLDMMIGPDILKEPQNNFDKSGGEEELPPEEEPPYEEYDYGEDEFNFDEPPEEYPEEEYPEEPMSSEEPLPPEGPEEPLPPEEPKEEPDEEAPMELPVDPDSLDEEPEATELETPVDLSNTASAPPPSTL